jgi:hypothetical protein
LFSCPSVLCSVAFQGAFCFVVCIESTAENKFVRIINNIQPHISTEKLFFFFFFWDSITNQELKKLEN